MKITDYQIYAISDGDLVLGVRGINPQETVLFSGIQSAGTTSSLVTEVQLDSSDILNMSNLELLPSIATDKYYDIDKVIIEFKAGSIAYSTTVDVEILGAINNVVDSGLITSLSDKLAIISSNVNVAGSGAILAVEPGFGVFINSTTLPTLGNGTMRILFFYNIRTFDA